MDIEKAEKTFWKAQSELAALNALLGVMKIAAITEEEKAYRKESPGWVFLIEIAEQKLQEVEAFQEKVEVFLRCLSLEDKSPDGAEKDDRHYLSSLDQAVVKRITNELDNILARQNNQNTEEKELVKQIRKIACGDLAA